MKGCTVEEERRRAPVRPDADGVGTSYGGRYAGHSFLQHHIRGRPVTLERKRSCGREDIWVVLLSPCWVLDKKAGQALLILPVLLLLYVSPPSPSLECKKRAGYSCLDHDANEITDSIFARTIADFECTFTGIGRAPPLCARCA